MNLWYPQVLYNITKMTSSLQRQYCFNVPHWAWFLY